MALNNLGLGFIFTARDLASGTIRQVGAGFGHMDSAATRASSSYARNFAVMGAGLGIMGAGAATLAGAFALAGAASHFEMELARVGAIARADAGQLQRLHDAAIQAGIATQFTPTMAIEGLGVLAAQGFNTTQSIQLLTPALDLAAGGMISVEQAAEAVTNATHVFNLSMDQAANSANQLLRISNITALRSGELGNAMGTVARGARMTHQSIEEMLPSIGLLRNTGLDASTAANSVSSALMFMSMRAQKIHDTLGVNLVRTLADGTQEFRPFMDIVMDAGTALEERFANPAERTAAATQLFSRFGVGAVTGVFDSLRRGVTDSQGRLHQGTEAINYLRDSMRNAGGAAEEFRNRMLSTFAGQQILLHGSMETLKIAIGEGFTRAIRPLVSGAITVVNHLIEFIQGIPVEIRGAIGQAVIFVGALLTAIGGFIAAGAAIALIVPFLKAIALAVGGLLLAMLPLIVAFGALAGAGYVVYRISQRNVEVAHGLARAWDTVRLTFLGLSQAVTEGAFSGAVMEELDRAENGGIRRFILQVAGIGFRIVQFFRGVGIGFEVMLRRMGPSVDALMTSLNTLSDVLGGVQEAGTGAVSAMPSEKFAAAGARVGVFVGGVIESMIKLFTVLTDISTGLILGWQKMMDTIGPIVDALGPSFSFLGKQISELGDSLGFTSDETDDSSTTWQKFGRVVGALVVGAIGTLAAGLEGIVLIIGAVVWATQMTIHAFRWLHREAEIVGLGISRYFMRLNDAIEGTFDGLVSMHAGMARLLPTSLQQSLGLGGLIGAGAQADARIAARHAGAVEREANIDRMQSDAAAGPAAAEAFARADRDATNASALTQVAELVRKQAAERQHQPPMVVNLQVDGETLATAQVNAERRDTAASFGTSPRGAER